LTLINTLLILDTHFKQKLNKRGMVRARLEWFD